MGTEPSTTSVGTPITRRDHDRQFDRVSNETHTFILQRFQARVLEVEDVHFNHDSAVMLPDWGDCDHNVDTADQNDVSGLAILRTAYLHAQRHTEDQLLIAGHTDRSGGDAYNLTLSELRAKNVHALLMGDRDEWVRIAQQKHKPEDIKQILKWVDTTYGWGCDPGPVNETPLPQPSPAVLTFQQRYNQEFHPPAPTPPDSGTTTSDADATSESETAEASEPIGEDGYVGEETWGAFFDVYMKGLKEMLQTDDAGLQSLRDGITFMNDGQRLVGCGERHPISEDTRDGIRSRVNRRVEMLFFDPAELPNMDCHPGSGGCQHQLCEIYGQNSIFTKTPIPCVDWRAHTLYLHLQWTDPENVARDMPQGLPVTVEVGSNPADNVETVVGPGGRVVFTIDRTKGSFTLRFRSTDRPFVSVAPAGSTDDSEVVIPQNEVRQHIDDRKRVFKLPRNFSLKMSDWAVSGTSATTAPFANGEFTGLQDAAKTVGRPGSPARLTLDPHWMYLRFTYFDRFHEERLSVPPCVIDGFNSKSTNTTSGEPDTLCNWKINTDAEARQCLPWILQKTETGDALPKPDSDTVVRYRTAPGTFIESSGTNTRRMISRNASNPGGTDSLRDGDPSINAGVSIDFDPSEANFDRMRFYDLPQIWKSQQYFARLDGPDNPPHVDDGPYESKATEATSDASPMCFSLDDMVLYTANSSGDLDAPISWSTANDRIAIVAHNFSDTAAGTVTNLSPFGVYKPDDKADTNPPAADDHDQAYFSEQVADLSNRNYIADYPDWVRVCFAQGNAFDVFDKRTPDSNDQVVGARAAVRWVDATASPNFVQPGNTFDPRPSTSNGGDFFKIQPFYECEVPYNGATAQFPNSKIGRYDQILLRCCGVDKSTNTEIGFVLAYFKFFFNFNSSVSGISSGTPAASMAGQPVGARFINNAIVNILTRWNGQDTHAGGATLQQIDNATDVQFRVRWFAQALAKNQSHFELGIFMPPFRASMGSFRGNGSMGLEDNPGSWDALRPPPVLTAQQLTAYNNGKSGFTNNGTMVIAHEAGHGYTLNDEYHESSRSGIYLTGGVGPIYSFCPGSPFNDDRNSMMLFNRTIRGRHYWHVAEWVNDIYQSDGLEFEVNHLAGGANRIYRLPHHSNTPKHTYVTRPWREATDHENGTRGKFDAFLYALGHDVYAKDVLGSGQLSGAPNDIFFDGLLCIVVRMSIELHTNLSTSVQAMLRAMTSRINAALNDRTNHQWVAAGSANGRAFERCIVHFSPRYVVKNYPTSAADTTAPVGGGQSFKARYDGAMGTTNQASYNSQINSIISTHGIQFEVEGKNSGSTQWKSGVFTGDNELELRFNGNNPAGWQDAFGNMLGINNGGIGNAANFQSVLQAVFSPGVTIAEVSSLTAANGFAVV